MKYLLVLCLLFCACNLTAQTIALQLDKMNVLYLGVDNPVTVAVEGYSNKSIFLTTDNGTITGTNGHFNINPNLPAYAMAVHIMLRTAHGVKELGTSTFHAKCPNPAIRVSLLNKQGGKIRISDIRKAIGPYASYDGFEYGASPVIDKMTVIITRGDEVIFDKTLHNGNRVKFTDDEETKNAIQSLQPGDHLMLDNMTYLNTTKNCPNALLPIKLIIIE